MSAVATIQAKAVDKIIRAAALRAVPAERLYEAISLNPAVLDDPDQRIPFAQVVTLYEKAAELTGDDAFGLHVGEEVDPKAFDVLGYAVINSPNLGEALDRMVRYNFIWTNGSSFAVERGPAWTRIVYSYNDDSIKERRQDAEMTLAAMAALGRMVTHSDLSPVRVTFQHPQPRDTSEHKRIFRCPVEFSAGSDQYFFPSAALDLPIVKADPGLCAVLDRHAAELAARYPRADSLQDRVRNLIKNELSGGNASIDRIAAHLGMSARTLQRKLRAAGTSHQELLDEMRRDLAMRYLREPEMAACEVAYLLGFSESSAFHRAFKRWTGTTPKEFRKR
ncbi:MAG TPA: AraC family transcriptional regulator [Pyrinomonadaceae bacterium]|nr:AraC family transcriptional regulator [Pyrinomonadaceae bacterium]